MAVVHEICGNLEVNEDIDETDIVLDNGDEEELEKLFEVIKCKLRYTGYYDILSWTDNEIGLPMMIETKSLIISDGYKNKHHDKMRKYIQDKFTDIGIRMDVFFDPRGPWPKHCNTLEVTVFLALSSNWKRNRAV